MIRNIAFALSIIGILSACTSSDKESSNTSDNSSFTFDKKDVGVFIPEEVKSNLAGKRRGKLSKLYSDGSSWFSFQVAQPFQELKITFSNQEFLWNTNDSSSTESKFLENINLGDTLSVDMVINNSKIQFFFNEGDQSFTYDINSMESTNRVDVALDGQNVDLPGTLYDIGI